MSEEQDFGNWFDAAGVDIDDVKDDPYQFGNQHWPLFVKEARAPKVSEKGKFGMYCLFEIADDRYAKVRPFGRWIQLPTPKAVCDEFGTTFDPKENLDDAKVVSFLIKFLTALGFGLDEIKAGKANHTTIQGEFFLAKLRARENEQGYDEILWSNPKEMRTDGSGEGMEQFVKPNDAVSDVEKALADDIANA